jgi:hypothetical protein
MAPPLQPGPLSSPPIWICPICQKLMRTLTIEVANGEEQTKLACATCGTEATQRKMLQTIRLTIEETRLLIELRDGLHSISGNKRRDSLSRLVDVKYVESRAISLDTVVYTITWLGRQALADAGQHESATTLG